MRISLLMTLSSKKCCQIDSFFQKTSNFTTFLLWSYLLLHQFLYVHRNPIRGRMTFSFFVFISFLLLFPTRISS